MKYDAVVFDLLTALIDSWTLWNDVAGSPENGMKWRRRYLGITYGCGAYRPYETLVREAARPPTPRKKTRVSKAAKRRRVDDKKHHGAIKSLRSKRADD